MTALRALRRLIGLGLVTLMLFAQLAIAAYACPALSAAAVQASSAIDGAAQDRTTASQVAPGNDAMAADEAMAGCDQMAGEPDRSSPNLCVEHCRAGQQSSQVDVPVVPAATLISLYRVSVTPVLWAPPVPARAAPVDRLAAASPPHAVLHCVYRI